MKAVREPMAQPPEIAEHLGVTVETLANWRYLGRGPKWAKVGGRVRYRWTDVDAFVEQSRAVA